MGLSGKRRVRWLARKLERLRDLASAIGPGPALSYLIQQTATGRRAALMRIHPRGVLHPLWVRRGSSDMDTFQQIFVDKELACLDDLHAVSFVVDCGANAGYASAYLLSRHRNCQILAVEPDPGNFELLRKNLAPYGERARVLKAGVWSRNTSLRIAEEPYRDGREWTRQVRECLPDEPSDIEGVTMHTLIESSGHTRISLLKMDIEGAEVEVFSDKELSWLAQIDSIAIELHDDSAFGSGTQAFMRAIDGNGFDISRWGELTIARRGTPR